MEIETVTLIINGVNILLFVALIQMTLSSMMRYGRTTIGTTFLYYLSGLLLLGSITSFFLLTDLGIIHAEEMTVMATWHLLFYVAVLLHGIASYSFVNLFIHAENHDTYRARAIILVIIALISIAAVVVFFPSINHFAMHTLEGSAADRLGVPHFIAFAEALIASIFIIRIKTRLGHPMDTIVNPYLASLFVLGVIHAWELTTESWHIITINPEMGEMVEAVLWIVVYTFLITALVRFRKSAEPVMKPVMKDAVTR